jgi:hypothetical protein
LEPEIFMVAALRRAIAGSNAPGRTGGPVMVELSELATTEEVLAEQLQDPEFAKEWDRTAFARAVAERILAYRTEKGLTQTQLARQAATVQSVIARLESGE